MKIKNFNEGDLMTARDVAEYMNVSIAYIYKLTSSKQIPYYKPRGGRIYFDKSDVLEFARGRKIIPTAEVRIFPTPKMKRRKPIDWSKDLFLNLLGINFCKLVGCKYLSRPPFLLPVNKPTISRCTNTLFPLLRTAQRMLLFPIVSTPV